MNKHSQLSDPQLLRPSGDSVAAIRLELIWPGKDKFLLVTKDENGKPVWVERDHPAASEVRLTELTGVVGEVGEASRYGGNLLFTELRSWSPCS